MSETHSDQQTFEDGVAKALSLLESAQDLLQQDVPPSSELRNELVETLSSLEGQYQEMISTASAFGVIADGMPFSWYVAAIEHEESSRALQEILNTLERFLTIGSDVPLFDSALDPFRLVARQKAQDIAENDSATPSHDFVRPESALLDAVNMPREVLLSDEGMQLIQQISEYYPSPYVSHGVMAGAYREGFHPAASLQEVASETAEGSSSPDHSSEEESPSTRESDQATNNDAETIDENLAGDSEQPTSPTVFDEVIVSTAPVDERHEQPEDADHRSLPTHEQPQEALSSEYEQESGITAPTTAIEEAAPISSEKQNAFYESLPMTRSSLPKTASAKRFDKDLAKMSPPAWLALMLLSRFGALSIRQILTIGTILQFEQFNKLDEDTLYNEMMQLFRDGYVASFETAQGKVACLTPFGRNNIRKQSVLSTKDGRNKNLWNTGPNANPPTFEGKVDAETLDKLIERMDALITTVKDHRSDIGFYDAREAFIFSYTYREKELVFTGAKQTDGHEGYYYAVDPEDIDFIPPRVVAVVYDEQLGQQLKETLGEGQVLIFSKKTGPDTEPDDAMPEEEAADTTNAIASDEAAPEPDEADGWNADDEAYDDVARSKVVEAAEEQEAAGEPDTNETDETIAAVVVEDTDEAAETLEEFEDEKTDGASEDAETEESANVVEAEGSDAVDETVGATTFEETEGEEPIEAKAEPTQFQDDESANEIEPAKSATEPDLIAAHFGNFKSDAPEEGEPEETTVLDEPAVSPTTNPAEIPAFHDVLSMERPENELYVRLCEGIIEGSSMSGTLGERVGVALTLAKVASLSENGEELGRLFKKLLLATDSDFEDHEYTLDQIRDAFPDTEASELGQALLLATYLHAMFAPTKPYDYDLWDAFDFYAENYDEFFAAYPEVKPLFYEMQGIHNVSQQHGFTPAIIAGLDERARNKNLLQEIRKTAEELTEVRKVKNQILGVHDFHEAAFGKNSELGKAMAAIAADDGSALEEVTELAHRFAGEDLLASKSDLEAIEEAITQTWRDHVVGRVISHKHKGNKDLSFEARTTAIGEYRKRIEVMCRWVSYKKSHTSDEVLKEMGKKRTAILEASEQTLGLLSQSSPRKGSELLAATIDDLRDRLSGETTGYVVFTDFLRTGLISLSDDLNPTFYELEDRIPHFEPWRRVLLHAQERDISFEEALARTQERGRYSYENFRQMRQLQTLVGKQLLDGNRLTNALKMAAKEANARLSTFKNELEIWFAYGRIDDDQRETLSAIADDMHEPLFEDGNFGLWNLLIDALTMTSDDWAALQYDELHERYEAALAQSNDSEPCQLLRAARKLLEDERNYAVVEDYLNRFETGEKELPSQDTDDEEDAFSIFMSDEVYQPLYEIAVGAKESTIRFKMAARRAIAERHSNHWTTGQIDNANSLVKYWPSNIGYNTTQLSNLFNEMGFDSTYGEKVKASDTKAEHYRVHLKPKPRNLQSYSHPIAAFGTQSVESIDVVVAYENTSAPTLVSLVSSLSANEAVAVLVDYHLDRATRRQVAERYMKMSPRPTKFLLIDRVLLMHLALMQKEERLPTLLKCTLPLTHLQPFTDGSGATPDEMFCGRVEELDALKDFNSTRCIIYGGRQLGKTALLERAASLVNSPKDHIFAVIVTIKDMTDEASVVKKILQELNRELKKAKKNLAIRGCDSISELCLQIDELIENREIVRLLLMLDETDAFLMSIASNNYFELEPFEELRRKRAGSFKFVLAGLHNVVRAARSADTNPIFGRLGEPICVKPLPPRDALRLLRRPLMYLGYHVDYPNIETILTNTNYYPGLVQYFGNRLVDSMSTHFGVYYSAARSNPPYLLKERQLASIFADNDINDAIRRKFMWTLELDERKRYMLIAQIIAALYYERKNEGRPTNEGFTAREIKAFSDGWHFTKLSLETDETFLALLDELCEMGVLAHVGPNRKYYRIRRSTFLGYIGSEEEIWDVFDKEELDG